MTAVTMPLVSYPAEVHVPAPGTHICCHCHVRAQVTSDQRRAQRVYVPHESWCPRYTLSQLLMRRSR